MQRLLFPYLLLDSTGTLPSLIRWVVYTALHNQPLFFFLLACILAVCFLALRIWYKSLKAPVERGLYKLFPFTPAQKGFLNLTHQNAPLLLAISSIASVKARSKKESVITLYPQGNAAADEPLVVSIPYDELLRKIQHASQ